MIDFIEICGKFIGGILRLILSIEICEIPFGILLIIVTIIGLTINILKGGKGD